MAFNEPIETKAKPAVTTAKVPLENVPSKRTGSGSVKNVPVAGCPLPPVEHIQWEAKRNRPGWYAWHAPQGSKAPRSTKTYLGYVGKRLMAEWDAMPPDERGQVIRQWVADRRKEKGIS